MSIKFSMMVFTAKENIFENHKYKFLIESARYADENGFSNFWIPERHFTDFGSLYPSPAILHAALASQTERIGLNAGSVVLPLHNPIRVVEDWAIVDNLSNGRVGISFAPGWHPNDFAFFPERYLDRHDLMYDSVQVVKELWQGKEIIVTVGNDSKAKIRVYPTPIQPQLPIWITAASSAKSFSKAGKIGANLLTHLFDQNIEALAEKITLYRKARKENGFDPCTGIVTVAAHTFIGSKLDEVKEQARNPYCSFLRSNLGLLKNLWHSRGSNIDPALLSDNEISDVTNFVFERFFAGRSLLGTPETCFPFIEEMNKIDVDEIACLLDFGLTTQLMLKGLPYINELKNNFLEKSEL